MAAPIDFKDLDKFLVRYGSAFIKYANRIEIVALKEVEGLMKRRIFNNGIASNGTGIGSYSTSPMLVGGTSFATPGKANNYFGTKAKRKAMQWVTYKGNALAVLNGGYAALRALQGFQTSHVDLSYKGDLFRSVQVGKTATNQNVIGFLTDKQRLKAEGQESHWGKKIFAISQQESDAMNKAIIKEIDFIISKI